MNFPRNRFQFHRPRPTEKRHRSVNATSRSSKLSWSGWAAAVTAMPLLLVLSAGIAYGHDLFLRPVSFFVAPGGQIVVRIVNGTFSMSEAAVTGDRARDLRVVTPEGTMRPPTGSVEIGGKESSVRVRAGTAGTYIVGMSLLPRTIRLSAKDFNQYLASDGIPDIIAFRTEKGEMGLPSHERYSKHVKALIQVGENRTARVDEVFGYPAEIVPLDNPYRIRTGRPVRVRLLVDGQPVAGQTLIIGGRPSSGNTAPEEVVKSGPGGIAVFRQRTSGKWYAKFISMKPMRGSPGDSVDYESKWATLTFGVK